MSRNEFTKATKRDAFMRAEGRCEGKLPNGERCNVKLRPGSVHYDHIIAEWLTRDNSLDNCQALCLPCHKHKTTKEDVPAIAKVKRIQDQERGIKSPSSFQTNRNSKFKKKLNGQVVLR